MSAERTGTLKVKKKYGKVFEKPIIRRDIIIDADQMKDIEKDIKAQSVITPQTLANKHHIRVSIARRILRKMADDGQIHLKFKSSSQEIYAK